MTQEERIVSLEQEVLILKDELRKTRKANVWKKVKDKFSEEFTNFDWVDIFNTVDCEGRPLRFTKNMNESYHISQAIGILVRITLQRKGVNYLEECDEEKAEKITKAILEIMKREKVMRDENEQRTKDILQDRTSSM